MAVPFMPLYVADYMADTAHLTTVEHGAYLLLIMTYWQRGEALPDDDKKLARIVGLQGRNWKRVRQEIEPFFEFRDNKWVHQRIEHQLTVMRSQSRANSLNGKKGGLAKAKASPSENLAKPKRTLSHTDTDTDTRETKVSQGECDDLLIYWQSIGKPLGLACWEKLSPKRKRTVQARIREHGIESIKAAMDRVHDSSFLRGERGDWGGANLDFIFRPDSVPNILEGKYDDRARPTTRQIGERLAASYESGNDCLPDGLPLVGAARGS